MRIAVFASYDKTGKIHDYVLSYLRYLKGVAEKIIFISDNEVLKSEQDKLKNLVDHTRFERHGEYDFGSYKRGYEYAEHKGWLAEADELILCNDSCFCVHPLKPIFEKMDKQEGDFWGLSANNEIQPHIQSFFLVFKKKVFTSKTFKDFMQSVKKQPDAQQVILTYEIPLKALLNDAGFKDKAYLEPKDKYNPMRYSVDCLKQGFPLLKKKAFCGKMHSANSSRQILREIKNISLETHKEIITFFRYNFCSLFPLITPGGIDAMRTFLHKLFWQKKTTKSGKTIIKICKIPVLSIAVFEEKIKYRILFFKFSKSTYLKLNYKILKEKTHPQKTILFFDMYLGGGTSSYFKNYISDLSTDKNVIRVQNTENPNTYTLTLFDTHKKYRMIKIGLEELFSTLKQLPISKIIISNLISWKDPLNVLQCIENTFKKDIPISLCIHDYFSVCPFYTLMENGHYCGGAQEKCKKCFLTNNGSNKRQKDYANQYDISTWRQRWGQFLRDCVDEIIVFSESSKKIISQAYPKLENKITIIPHKVPYLRPCYVLPHTDINICVVGGSTEDAKGMYILQQMEKIVEQKSGIHLIIVGCYEKISPKTIVTGAYKREELPDILEKYQADIVMLPSICPETFSYVASEGIMTKLPVTCFNIGAPVERISKYKKGLIISKIDAQTAIDEITSFLTK